MRLVTAEHLRAVVDSVRALVGPVGDERDQPRRKLLHDARNVACAITLYEAVPRDDSPDDVETWREIVDATIALQASAREYVEARAAGVCPCCGQRVPWGDTL